MNYTCPKCSSSNVHWSPLPGLFLKCWDCENVWAFRFILFIQEWKAKVTA